MVGSRAPPCSRAGNSEEVRPRLRPSKSQRVPSGGGTGSWRKLDSRSSLRARRFLREGWFRGLPFSRELGPLVYGLRCRDTPAVLSQVGRLQGSCPRASRGELGLRG